MEARLNLSSQETRIYKTQQTFKTSLIINLFIKHICVNWKPYNLVIVDIHGVTRRKRRRRVVCPYDPSSALLDDFHFKIGEDYKKDEKEDFFLLFGIDGQGASPL